MVLNSFTPKILIVEDNHIIGNHLNQILKIRLSDQIFWTTSGKKAMNYLKTNMPDLIVMNINLGGEMTGLDLTKYIRSFRMIPILFFTGYKKERIPAEIWRQPSFYFLPKPFVSFQLIKIINSALNT